MALHRLARSNIEPYRSWAQASWAMNPDAKPVHTKTYFRTIASSGVPGHEERAVILQCEQTGIVAHSNQTVSTS